MSEYQTTTLSAALLYQDHDPLSFKHLATTLNLILEPANLNFRVIHEQAGRAGVLSCRRLHVTISANEAALSSEDLQKKLRTHAGTELDADLRKKVETHRRAIEISVGIGPVPHGPAQSDPQSETLRPLLAQIVVNHLLNMNPGDAVYWSATDRIMSPKAFLAMINAPISEEPKGPRTPRPPMSRSMPPANDRPTNPDVLRRDIIEEKEQAGVTLTPSPSRLRPSFLAAHLGDDQPAPSFELSDHIQQRLDAAIAGPKAAFVVSVATMLVAPIVGILLLMYNFMGGARLRRTAMLACVAAAVTLAADLMNNDEANATAAAPVKTVETVQL